MKVSFRAKRILLVIITGLCSHGCFAQSKAVTEVKAAVEALKKAMTDADSIALDKWTATGLSYGHSSGVVEDKQTFISKILSGKSDFVSIGLSDQAITVSGNTALVRHTLDAVTNNEGKPGEVHLLILLVWQKQHGLWKLLARQAVKQP